MKSSTSRGSTSDLEVISNPFATCRVRPGEIPWMGKQQQSLDSIIATWESQGGRIGALVGPHGTGKSTLLRHLVPRCFSSQIRCPGPSLQSCHGSVVWIQLRRGQNVRFRQLPSILWKAEVCDWILDGYEQLWFHQKVFLLCRQRLRGGKLLVTAHRQPIGVPLVYRTESSPQLAMDLVDYLLRDVSGEQYRAWDPASKAELETQVSTSWHRNGGNLREVFMDLYDRFGSGPKLIQRELGLERLGTSP